MKIIRPLIGVFLIINFICVFVLNVYAGEKDQTVSDCSVTVDLSDGDLEEIQGVDIHVIKVLNQDYSFTDAYKGCSIALSDLEKKDAPKKLYEYSIENSLDSKTRSGKTDSNGKASFSDLTRGIYLIYTVKENDYQAFEPILAELPEEINGVKNNSVTVYPKTVPKEQKTTEATEEKTTEKKKEEKKTEEKSGSKDTEDKSKKNLMQTGQLNWPVPVMTLAGLVMMITGIRVRENKKESDEE